MYQSVKIYDKMQRSVPFGGGSDVAFCFSCMFAGLDFSGAAYPDPTKAATVNAFGTPGVNGTNRVVGWRRKRKTQAVGYRSPANS